MSDSRWRVHTCIQPSPYNIYLYIIYLYIIYLSIIYLYIIYLYIIYLYNIYLYNFYLYIIYLYNIYLYNIYLHNIYLYNIYLYNIYLYNIYLINIYLYNIYLYNIYLFIIYLYNIYLYHITSPGLKFLVISNHYIHNYSLQNDIGLEAALSLTITCSTEVDALYDMLGTSLLNTVKQVIHKRHLNVTSNHTGQMILHVWTNPWRRSELSGNTTVVPAMAT